MEYDLEKYKEILLKTIESFDLLCKKHNLKYVAAFGTMLGAVRHNGLIPWDDDFDVYMTREDYDRLLSLRNDSSMGDYEIIDRQSCDNYPLPYAKYCDKNSTIWEERLLPFVIGVFIDVFPLDEATDSKESRSLKKKYWRIFKHYRTSCQNYTWEDVHSFKEFRKWVRNKRWKKNRTKAIEQLDQIEKQIMECKGDHYLYYRAINSFERSLFPKKWFEDIVECPFEHITTNIIKEYDQYLKLCYGNYMQLPPVEERVSVHSHYYVNLEKRETIDELQKKLK